MSFLSISTWSLHRKIGPLRRHVWDEDEKKICVDIENQPEHIELEALPAILADKGFKAVEICHFHFPSTEPAYLEVLRQACERSYLTIHTLLVDYGDLSSTDESRIRADMAFIKEWIEVAYAVGAKYVRVIAGKSEPTDGAALRRVSQHLNELVIYAQPFNIGIITENFQALTSEADNCLYLVQQSIEQVKLITDFGNFNGPSKYNDLAKTLPYSVSVHAKPDFDVNGIPDQTEFEKCLDILNDQSYNGPITLIYDGPGDMWSGIARVRKIVEPFL